MKQELKFGDANAYTGGLYSSAPSLASGPSASIPQVILRVLIVSVGRFENDLVIQNTRRKNF
jgi:hypothetical protein